MAINKYIDNGAVFASTFKETGNQPLDARQVVSKLSDVAAESGESKKSQWTGFGYYAGMLIVDQDSGAIYTLDKDTTKVIGAKDPWLTGSWTRRDANAYTLPIASTSVLGGVKLGSDTAQSVAANEVSATSGRTYAVQFLNNTQQMVVNVPWTDTPPLWEGE